MFLGRYRLLLLGSRFKVPQSRHRFNDDSKRSLLACVPLCRPLPRHAPRCHCSTAAWGSGVTLQPVGRRTPLCVYKGVTTTNGQARPPHIRCTVTVVAARGCSAAACVRRGKRCAARRHGGPMGCSCFGRPTSRGDEPLAFSFLTHHGPRRSEADSDWALTTGTAGPTQRLGPPGVPE